MHSIHNFYNSNNFFLFEPQSLVNLHFIIYVFIIAYNYLHFENYFEIVECFVIRLIVSVEI